MYRGKGLFLVALVAFVAACSGGSLFAGVARTDDGLLLIHDLAAFLTEAEELKLDEALSATPVGRGKDDQAVAQ